MADALRLANQNAQSLRLGSEFSFVAMGENNSGLLSKMGEFDIVIPKDQLPEGRGAHKLLSKQLEAVVTEIDKEAKRIVGSVKLLQEQTRVAIESNFWNSIFINKIVVGKVERIMPYGAFVSVDGFDCFLHISQISYERLEKVEDALNVGDERQFRVIKLDRENKKVELSLKALLENPKLTKIKELEVGGEYDGEVVKLLQFGAIVQVSNGASGLLHISNCTQDRTKKIYEIVKVGDRIRVEVLSKEEEEGKVSFSLANQQNV